MTIIYTPQQQKFGECVSVAFLILVLSQFFGITQDLQRNLSQVHADVQWILILYMKSPRHEDLNNRIRKETVIGMWKTYTSKQYEMLKACIQMGLLLEAYNFLEMRVIDVSIYTEQSFEYCLHNILEIGREGCPYNNGTRYKKVKRTLKQVTIFDNSYQAFEEISIRYQAGLQSSPLKVQHILEQKPQQVSLFFHHLPIYTRTCQNWLCRLEM